MPRPAQRRRLGPSAVSGIGFGCMNLSHGYGSPPAPAAAAAMPRFDAPNHGANLRLLERYRALASRANCSPAQLALAWLPGRGEHVIPIPGTTRIEHLEENLAAADVELTAELSGQLDALINQRTIAGARYNAAIQAEIDTENYP